jgi:hypothetical protein
MKATSFNVGELVDVKKGAITYAKVTIKTINEEANTIYGTYRTKKDWPGSVTFKPEQVTTWHATGADLLGRK